MMKAKKAKEVLRSNNPVDPNDFTSLSDEKVISEVKAGNTNLFEVIVRRYNQQLFRILRSYLLDEEDVKDAMQTAYLKAFDKLHQFRAEAQFSTWLIRIAINEALKLSNSNKKRTIADLKSVTKDTDGDQKNRSGASTPETKAIQNDMKDFVEQAIDRLPEAYRKVFVMREIEQMSTKETAEYLNITRVNVKVRLHRAKGMLKNELLNMVDDTDVFRFRGERCDHMTASVMSKIRGLEA